MRILVLGGTAFLGRHFVEAAINAGHDVTYVHRGTTNQGLFPAAREILLDRKTDIDQLEGTFDAVYDTCGYHPRDVRASVKHLSSLANHYVFVSTVSVYADMSNKMVTEQNAVATLDNPEETEVSNESYGALKACCEQEVLQGFDGATTIIRPGLIVGPFDPTDRFTYWPVRVQRGGNVLCPGSPDRNIQFVDVRDLAEWSLRIVEHRTTGLFHVSGHQRTSMQEFVETCKSTLNKDAQLHWVDDATLAENSVGPWMEMPLWIPEEKGPFFGMMNIDLSLAFAHGFSARPIVDTIRDTWQWYESVGKPELKTGLNSEKEREILEKRES